MTSRWDIAISFIALPFVLLALVVAAMLTYPVTLVAFLLPVGFGTAVLIGYARTMLR